jgi:deoxycytidine triphosphate deaminase
VPAPISLPEFATTNEEAAKRFEATRHRDPFPQIAPALLNTADLVDYIAATGMVHPFRPDPHNPSLALKPASCAIPLGGTVVWWETRGGTTTKRERELQPDEKLALAPNSIVYVTLAPELRMPDYIAARFNLTIRDIYRGLLVGTGPLVDPGFTGRLSLPLHNLTPNDYELTGGEPIVWMEFTKLSTNECWQSDSSSERRGEYVPFPERKRRQTLSNYLGRASSRPIMSSIPSQVGRAEAAAIRAERTTRRIFTLSGFAAVGVIAAIAALVIASYQLVDGVNGRQQELTQQVDALRQRVSVLRAKQAAQHRAPATRAGTGSP